MSLERTSRYMSLILRHKPEVIGIQLDEHGWANVEELIAGIAKTQEFNRDILELIVRTDEKQRYSFNHLPYHLPCKNVPCLYYNVLLPFEVTQFPAFCICNL